MTLSTSQNTAIKNALTSLIESDSMDAFLCITEKNTHKFIQFEMEEDALVLDFPTKQLNKNQISRAKEILLDYQIHFGSRNSTHEVSEEKEMAAFEGFNQIVNQDLEQLLELLDKIITQVFDVKSTIDLHLEEN